MLESKIHDRALVGLMNDTCTDEEFVLILKWFEDGDPVAVRIMGFYKIAGYRVPLNPTEGWHDIEQADKLGDLLARTFVGNVYCRELQTKFFRITPNAATYGYGKEKLKDAASKGWKAAQTILETLP